jgi:hypothetical protein
VVSDPCRRSFVRPYIEMRGLYSASGCLAGEFERNKTQPFHPKRDHQYRTIKKTIAFLVFSILTIAFLVLSRPHDCRRPCGSFHTWTSTLSHRFLSLRHDCDVNSEISFRVTHCLGTINHSRVMLPIDSFSFETCFSLHVSLFIHV